jgi:hypothetical protein
VLHLRLIILLVRGDVIDSELLLETDSMNLKMKPAQYLGYAYRGRICVHIFIGISARTCALCFYKKMSFTRTGLLALILLRHAGVGAGF